MTDGTVQAVGMVAGRKIEQEVRTVIGRHVQAARMAASRNNKQEVRTVTGRTVQAVGMAQAETKNSN